MPGNTLLSSPQEFVGLGAQLTDEEQFAFNGLVNGEQVTAQAPETSLNAAAQQSSDPEENPHDLGAVAAFNSGALKATGGVDIVDHLAHVDADLEAELAAVDLRQPVGSIALLEAAGFEEPLANGIHNTETPVHAQDELTASIPAFQSGAANKIAA